MKKHSYKDYICGDFPQTKLTAKRYLNRISFIKPYAKGNGLDIGGENIFTGIMRKQFNLRIDNTEGDIDYGIIAPLEEYNFVVCSHIIEHVMNPLAVMDGIYNHLTKGGMAFLFYPTTLRQLKGDKHFHEIPVRDMKNLIEKSGFQIVEWEKIRFKIGWFGIRPLIRKIFYIEHFIALKK